MKSESRMLLAKSRRTLEAARFLLSGGYPDSAASRTYYAAFYAAEAFLLEHGLSFSSHSAVLSAFGREARARQLPAELHRTLLDAFETRNAVDYGGASEPTDIDTQRLLERVSSFVAAVEAILGAGESA